MKKLSVVLIFTSILVLAFSAAAWANPLETLRTPAEESEWERTTSSQEVIDYCLQVVEHSGGRIRMEYIATTAQNRPVPMLIIGNPAPTSAADVSSDKAITLVNCNIHSGEVEGKEAMLIFAREVALGEHDDLLKDLVILLVINMNPDGNDDLDKHRISSQFTPKLVGTRYTGEGYNINRDMTKLDSAEARGVVGVMNDWDPVIFVDAHATNGSFMRHAITYNWGLHPNTDPELMAYNRDEFSELALGSKSYLYEQGKIAVPYGNFGENYSGIVADGWRTFEDYPRYTTNYAGLRNRLAILLEVYSYDPFPTRVETQYECIYGTLLAVQQEKDHIKQLIAAADARSLQRATNGIDPEKDVVALNSELAVLTEVNGGKLDVLSYAVGDDGKVAAEKLRDAEGDYFDVEFQGETVHSIDYWGKFVPIKTEVMGAYYLVEADGSAGVELLQMHGVQVQQLTADVTLTAEQLQWYDVTVLNRMTEEYEGHLMNRLDGSWKAPAEDTVIPAGTYVVSTAQPLGSFAALMLEPASVDGATSWNYFDDVLTPANGTVRAGFASDPTDSTAAVAIPIFKVGSYEAIPAASLAAVGGAEQPAPDVSMDFTDVAESDWFYAAVEFAYGRELFSGTSATTFSPQNTMTRGMLVTVLWRLAGEPAAGTADVAYTDLEAGSYYEQAARWAVQNGIAVGLTETEFAPDQDATREQLAAMLYNYAAYREIDVSAAADLSGFTDTGEADEANLPALRWAVSVEMISGKGEGILDPAGNATRAEVAAIFMRFVQNVI